MDKNIASNANNPVEIKRRIRLKRCASIRKARLEIKKQQQTLITSKTLRPLKKT